MQNTSVPPARTTETVIAKSASKHATTAPKCYGPPLATSLKRTRASSAIPNGETTAVSNASHPVDSEALVAVERVTRLAHDAEQTGRVGKSTRPPEALGNMLQRLVHREPAVVLLLESVVAEILAELDRRS